MQSINANQDNIMNADESRNSVGCLHFHIDDGGEEHQMCRPTALDSSIGQEHTIDIDDIDSIPAPAPAPQYRPSQQHGNQQLTYHARSQPSADGHNWMRLPTELILLIAQSVDGRSLMRLSTVDRFTHAQIEKNSYSLWRKLAQCHQPALSWMTPSQVTIFGQFFGPTSHLKTENKENPKQYYMRRWKTMLTYRKENLRERSTIPAEVRMLRLRWYEECVLPVLLYLLQFIFLIGLCAQLATNDGIVTLPTFVPLFLLLFLILVSSLNLLYISHRAVMCPLYFKSQTKFIDRFKFIQDSYLHEDYRSYIVRMLLGLEGLHFEEDWPFEEEQYFGAYFLGFISLCVLIYSVVMSSLRVSNHIETSWYAILLPLLGPLLLLFLKQLPCCTSRQYWWGVAPVVFLLLAPLVAFVTMLSVYLTLHDSSSSSSSTLFHHFSYVLVPLYFIDVLIFFVFILVMQDRLLPGQTQQCYHALMAGGMTIPLLVFKIILGDATDTSPSYPSLFVPLWIFQLFFGWYIAQRTRMNHRDLEKQRKEKNNKFASMAEAI